MAREININIRNTIDVTNSNNPNAMNAIPSGERVTPYTSSKKDVKGNPTLEAINAHFIIGATQKVGSAVGIDMSSFSKLAQYGFATVEAVAGIFEGNYVKTIQLVIQILGDTLGYVRKQAQEQAASENAIDQSRIKAGLFDISNTKVKTNVWSGRVTYIDQKKGT